MSQISFPNRLLFTVTALCPHLTDPPEPPEEWPAQSLLPALAELDGEETFARVQVGWNEEGLYVAATVPKSGPLVGNRQRPASGDSLHLWVEASDYWRCFVALPAVPGSAEPLLWEQRLRGRRETVAIADPQDLSVQVFRKTDTYTMLVHLPVSVLPDCTAEASEEVGFEYLLTDTTAGRQSWATPGSLSSATPTRHGPDHHGWLRLIRQ